MNPEQTEQPMTREPMNVGQEPIISGTEGACSPAASWADSRPEIHPQEAAVIRKLIKRIGRRHPVRRAAEAFLSGETVYPLTRELLLQSLQTPRPYHWRRQTVAAWMLGYPQNKSEDAEEVEKRLIKMVDIWRLRNVSYRLLRAAGWSGLLCAIYIVTTIFSMGHDMPSFLLFSMVLAAVFLSAFFALLLMPVLALVENSKMTRIRVTAVASLGRLHSVEGLPALARACLEGPESNSFRMRRTPHKMRSMALQAMEQVLPCVTEYDYARLASGIPNLCKVLDNLAMKSHLEPQLSERVALLILSALGKVGDGRATVIVERVAQTATEETVRRAAWSVLPLLQDRRRQENAANTLLRGASPNMAGQETLLRAVAPADQTDPAQLLRPNISPISPSLAASQVSESRTLEPEASEAETDGKPMCVYEPLAPETLVQQISEH